ncbi:hypothetical protein niasHT_014966 [Heterodera trifolii]|uniref:Lon proteolytic domain-containing protein n=1 Tax=Heterodera trifolii TaxID=157864 RepID=A0ABD2LFS1_9BILA
MSVSPVIHRMLSVEMREKQQRLITLNDLGVDMEQFMEFWRPFRPLLCSVQFFQIRKNVLMLLKLADFFHVDWLKLRCETQLTNCVDIEQFEHQSAAHTEFERNCPFLCRVTGCNVGTRTQYEMRRHMQRNIRRLHALHDTIVKLRHAALNRVPNFLETHYIDVRVLPEDQKVSGTSTGLAVFAATCSLAFGQSLRMDTTMRGVINNQPNVGDLDGVGAIRKKVKGARSAGMKRIILPATSCELTRLPPSVREGIEIEEVRTCEEVVND